MNYEWTNFVSDSFDGTDISSKNKSEATKAEESQKESLLQNAKAGVSRVDWEHLNDPENNVEIENAASDNEQEVSLWQDKHEFKKKSVKQKKSRLIQASMFDWDGCEKLEKEPARRKRKYESGNSEEAEIDDISVKEPEEPKVNLQHTMMIQGIRVTMPVKPYKCQMQVMTSIISGCKKEENCLLESPTGSGKTLALLCGALAWQSDFQSKLEESRRLEKNRLEAATSKSSQPEKALFGQLAENSKQQEVDEMDLSMFDWCEDNVADYSKSSESKKVPKIYYGSRTHRQLSQVVKELKKTVYRDKRMTVLSSREFSCIQETKRNKTELCAELLDSTKKMGCPYYNEHNKNTLGSYNGLYQNGIETPWDIEDLVNAGRETRTCPYFAARSLMLNADIIFCPYNYLVDPSIRETMQLDVNGHIIILDEAHNMEDICRESGSVSLTDSLLETIVNDCVNVLETASRKKIVHEAAYAAMIESYCQTLRRFIGSETVNPKKGAYDSASSKQWTGSEFVTLLAIKQLNEKTTSNFIRSAKEAISLFNSAKEDLRQGKIAKLPTLTTDGVRKLESILMALNMITSPQHAVDYRVVIKEITMSYKQVRSLEFLCMNPGVIFSPLSAMARTIILASGTLAPTSSFASELGVKFPFTIQANHVTPHNQMCVKCVGTGPNGKPLRAIYQNLNTWDFQDEVGSVVTSVCEAVPHGILVFFASYGAMNTLVTRWQSNNMMKKIATIKSVFQETRGSSDLASMMTNYREAIQNTSNGPVGQLNGAVLFAVFRGKVAEGIDFSDNEARAVLTIGIPFPVRSEPSVDMKFDYNEANKSKGLLSGHDWYTIQAFRALNQALGRAIRHKNDWGAIILIDERLAESRYFNYLPRWIQSVLPSTNGPQPDMSKCLREFVETQKKRENES